MDDKLIQIEVTGTDEKIFAGTIAKIHSVVDQMLNSVIDNERGMTVKEEAARLTSLGLNFFEEHLKKPGLANEKSVAEITEKFASAEKMKAETRKTNAEARKIDVETRKLEFEQSMKKLKVCLMFSRVIIINNKNEKAIAFTKQIDSFLSVLKNINEDQHLLGE